MVTCDATCEGVSVESHPKDGIHPSGVLHEGIQRSEVEAYLCEVVKDLPNGRGSRVNHCRAVMDVAS